MTKPLHALMLALALAASCGGGDRSVEPSTPEDPAMDVSRVSWGHGFLAEALVHGGGLYRALGGSD